MTFLFLGKLPCKYSKQSNPVRVLNAEPSELEKRKEGVGVGGGCKEGTESRDNAMYV